MSDISDLASEHDQSSELEVLDDCLSFCSALALSASSTNFGNSGDSQNPILISDDDEIIIPAQERQSKFKLVRKESEGISLKSVRLASLKRRFCS
jgi:hypothetical protein